MKKSKSTKPKVSKKKQPSCEDKIKGTILIALLIFAVACIIKASIPESPKFERGDCLINRAYELKYVNHVYKGLEDYEIRDVTVTTGYNGWFLSKETSGLQFKNISFVDANYTKVPCSNSLVRE